MESLKVITFLCSASLVQNFISYMLGLPYVRNFHDMSVILVEKFVAALFTLVTVGLYSSSL